MEENGYDVEVENVENLAPVKARYAVPPPLQSCHTAIVDGYVVEGHVPVDSLERLLAERPSIKGIAVPGMPVGSPGMDVAGSPAEPFDVIAFSDDGSTSIFDSYR